MIHRISYFTDNGTNPIINQPFDDSWIIYYLTDSLDYQMIVGKNNHSVYTVKVSKHYSQWKLSIGDFIQFYETRDKNILLVMEQDDLENAQQFYHLHKYNDNFLREYEPLVLIHSTTYENWLNIKKDNFLKSWNILKAEQTIWESVPIGQKLGDPFDFSNFIMFSGGEISSELVVLSKQKGEIIMNPDMEYKTGTRLYFDAKKIAEHGILIRDGIHLKVENKLPLEPYLLWYATWDSVGLTSNISTPKEFTQKSNEMFNHLFHDKSIHI